MKKFIQIGLTAMVLVLSLSIAGKETCFAKEVDNSSSVIDSVGNIFSAGEDSYIQDESFFSAFGAGMNIVMSNLDLKNDAALAGYTVSLTNSNVAGSAYLAGYNVSVTNSKVNGNIMAAGYNVDVEPSGSAKAVYAAGQTVTFRGESDYVNLSGQCVVLDGVVHGVAKIDADEIIITDQAVVEGFLSMAAKNAPKFDEAASIADYSFEQIEDDNEDTNALSSVIKEKVMGGIYLAIAMGLLSLLMSWLMKDSLNDAYHMIKERTGAMLGSGAITLIATPVAFVIACITVVGAPIGLITLLVYILMLIISITFTAASLGRMVFAKMNPVLASFLAVAIIQLIKIIPFIGIVIDLFSAIYTLGYFIQKLYLNSIKKKAQPLELIEEREE